MESPFVVCEEGSECQPDAEHPFVILVNNGQPVELLALDALPSVAPEDQKGKSAVILVISQEQASVELQSGNLYRLGDSLLADAPEAVGIILLDQKGSIGGVLSAVDILARTFEDREKLEKGGYQPSAGTKSLIRASVTYTCPTIGCQSPDFILIQKGYPIPRCRVHNLPRIRKVRKEAQSAVEAVG